MPELSSKTTPSSSVDKPIAMARGPGKKKNQKNEIFVDIFERISVTFNANVCSVRRKLVFFFKKIALKFHPKFSHKKSNVLGRGTVFFH